MDPNNNSKVLIRKKKKGSSMDPNNDSKVRKKKKKFSPYWY